MQLQIHERKIINILFIMVEETETKSTLQIRGEARLSAKREGRAGKETFGVKYCHLSGAADESQEIHSVCPDNLPLQFSAPAEQKPHCEGRAAAGVPARKGAGFLSI